MWLHVCENIFNLVKVYTCCCKIFKGLTFFRDTVYTYTHMHTYKQWTQIVQERLNKTSINCTSQMIAQNLQKKGFSKELYL